MQIHPAHLASPGKSAVIPGRAGGNDPNGANGPHAFGATLHDALQGSEACSRDSAPPRPQAPGSEHAATPTVPARAAKQAGDEEDTPAADAQLDGGLQAFVNSLQTPVTAMAAPATSATEAIADATAAAADAAAMSGMSTTATDADGVAALAADAAGQGKENGKAHAFGLDASIGARSHAQNGSARDTGSTADAAEAAGHGKDKVDGRDAHASLRAQEVAASKVAPEFRAALNDAQASRPGLQEALSENGSGSLAQALAAAATGTPAASSTNAAAGPGQAGHAAHVAPHLHAAQWQDAFGQQIVWMAKNEQQIASLTMNPPDLGPVRVTLSISDGQASAAFVSLQPEVRQAIQDAVPRLKEMLADAGLQLQQASVDSGDTGREGASRAQGEENAHRTRSASSAADADEAAMTADAASVRTARSIAASRLVDLFA